MYTSKMLDILANMRREMNGAVAAAMSERNIRYGLNYGVSIPTIKRIAEPYAPDQGLAEVLWRQDVRELKLSAIFIADPSEMTPAKMERWLAECHTEELVEHASMLLFPKAPGALSTAIKWLSESNTNNSKLRTSAFYISGKIAVLLGREVEGMPPEASSAGNDALFRKFVAAAENSVLKEKSAVYAFREIYRYRPGLRPEIAKMIEKLSSDDTAEEFISELKWQLEYLDA